MIYMKIADLVWACQENHGIYSARLRNEDQNTVIAY